MRVLTFQEWYTSLDLTGISMCQHMLKMMAALQGIEPMYFEWVLPKKDGQFRWDDSVFDLPYLRVHPIDPTGREDVWEQRPVNPDVISPFLTWRSKIAYDVILNLKYSQGVNFKMATVRQGSRWVFLPQMPVVTFWMETAADPRLPVLRHQSGEAAAIASSLAGPVLVLNDYDRDDLLRILNKWLRPEQVETIDIRIVHACFDASRIDDEFTRTIDQRRERLARDRTINVFHGGSLENKRHLPKIAQIVDDIATRTPARCVLRTQSKPISDQWPATTDIKYEVFHEEYMDSMHLGDILACAVDYEGTGIGYMEAIRSGMIPVVMAYPWITSRLPSDYPFQAKTMDEFAVMLEMVIRQYEVIRARWRGPLMRHFEPYTPRMVALQFYDAIRAATEQSRAWNLHKAATWNPFFGLLKQTVDEEGWPVITDPRLVLEGMQKRSRTGNTFSVNVMGMHWMLQAAGYRDASDGPSLHMIREPDGILEATRAAAEDRRSIPGPENGTPYPHPTRDVFAAPRES